MVTQLDQKPTEKTLYEQDFYQWIETTVNKLEKQEYKDIDWENLIEEVASLGRSEKHKLFSLLTRLLEHLLKLAYWETEKEYNAHHWDGEILNFRIQIKDLLEDSPSLKPLFNQILDQCYQDARLLVSKKSNLTLNTFPDKLKANLEQILDKDFYLS
jgi:hypothetical protein